MDEDRYPQEQLERTETPKERNERRLRELDLKLRIMRLLIQQPRKVTN